jgi:hypothetical protein
VPDPVVAEAVVEREAVFAVLHSRNESELLIDPRRLRKLTVHKWEEDPSGRRIAPSQEQRYDDAHHTRQRQQ